MYLILYLGVDKFLINVEKISKFWSPEWWHKFPTEDPEISVAILENFVARGTCGSGD
jgi:hypothetical protein